MRPARSDPIVLLVAATLAGLVTVGADVAAGNGAAHTPDLPPGPDHRRLRRGIGRQLGLRAPPAQIAAP